MANGLGSGVAEARGMLAFLPALAKSIIGRDLAMPNIATWWLGDSAVREAMLGHIDEMVVASAFSGDLPGEILGDGVLGADLGPRAATAHPAGDRRIAASMSCCRRRCGSRPCRSGATASSNRGPSSCGCS